MIGDGGKDIGIWRGRTGQKREQIKGFFPFMARFCAILKEPIADQR